MTNNNITAIRNELARTLQSTFIFKQEDEHEVVLLIVAPDGKSVDHEQWRTALRILQNNGLRIIENKASDDQSSYRFRAVEGIQLSGQVSRVSLVDGTLLLCIEPSNLVSFNADITEPNANDIHYLPLTSPYMISHPNAALTKVGDNVTIIYKGRGTNARAIYLDNISTSRLRRFEA